jgi:hypothetical protein
MAAKKRLNTKTFALPASGERGPLPSNGLESVKKNQQVART